MGRDQLSERMSEVGPPEGDQRKLWNEAAGIVYRSERAYDLLTRLETAEAINSMGWQLVRSTLMGVMNGTVTVADAESKLGVRARPISLSEALRSMKDDDKTPRAKAQVRAALRASEKSSEIKVAPEIVPITIPPFNPKVDIQYIGTLVSLDESYASFSIGIGGTFQVLVEDWKNHLGGASRVSVDVVYARSQFTTTD